MFVDAFADAAQLPTSASKASVLQVKPLVTPVTIAKALSAEPPKPASDKPIKSKEAQQHPKKLDDGEKQGRKVLAEEFLSWLKDGIAGQKFLVNDTNAKIHIVSSQLFLVTPGIFQRFCLEQTGQDEGWRKVQQGFEKLKRHKKRPDDLNIWACAVKGPRKAGKKIQGYLLEPTDFFSDTPMNNPFLTLVE
jgi:hypothetical protein